jgi:hypothetical protein
MVFITSYDFKVLDQMAPHIGIVGMGMVSPAGIRASDHVFFVRASLVTPPASPFETPDGNRVNVSYCPWLGARLEMGERMARMAETAIHEAVSPYESLYPTERFTVYLCTSKQRPGFTGDDVGLLAQRIKTRLRAHDIKPLYGAAAIFSGVKEAQKKLTDGHAQAVVLVGVDSFVHLDAVADHVVRPPSDWEPLQPPISEGAAALLLLPCTLARQISLEPLGIIGSEVCSSKSHDDNDDPVDGNAMNTAFRALPSQDLVGVGYGQAKLGNLRTKEWHYALVRNHQRFYKDTYEDICLETTIGKVGAAAGAMNLAYAAAVTKHRGIHQEKSRLAPSVAWAISRDGVRGIAMLEGAKS